VRLILFDIDGTLVDCSGQTRAPFAAALREVYGETGDIDRYEFSGKTDPRIVYDLLTGAGRAPEEVLERVPAVHDRYVEKLDATLDAARVRVLPGVRELLDALAARHDVALGLLTGNWRRGAGIKLARRGLDRYFAFGAFGDGVLDRDELPPVARARAREALGRDFAPEATLVVGDSPLDVACARAHGIPCLAVATGWTSAAALAAAGADRVIADLTATDAGRLADPSAPL
jgi:phosphoglycolate phosphatase-like HAD superfamily hydrolase